MIVQAPVTFLLFSVFEIYPADSFDVRKEKQKEKIKVCLCVVQYVRVAYVYGKNRNVRGLLSFLPRPVAELTGPTGSY